METEKIFRKIAQKRELLEKKKIKSTLNFKIKNFGDSGRIEWDSEIRKERLELWEFRENLWRWREQRGGEKKDGTEKKREITAEDLKNKMQNLIVDKEKRELEI